MPARGSLRALQSLEKRGGAVWAFKRGQGTLVVLTYAGRRDGGVVVRGTVSRDLYPGTLAGNFPRDELISLGWKEWKREWVLRTDEDRAELVRFIEESIELMAPTLGDQPTDYPLVYRPAGEEDAGYAQAGCVVSIISSLVGALVGALVALVGQSPLPLFAVGVLAWVVGFFVGFFGSGWLTPRVLALLPATRARAAEWAMSGFLIVPGLVAFLTWLIVPITGLVDAGQILGIAVGIFALAIVGNIVLVVGALAIQYLRSRL